MSSSSVSPGDSVLCLYFFVLLGLLARDVKRVKETGLDRAKRRRNGSDADKSAESSKGETRKALHVSHREDVATSRGTILQAAVPLSDVLVGVFIEVAIEEAIYSRGGAGTST